MKENKKEIIKEIIRFLFIGGLATICDYIVFYAINLSIEKTTMANWINITLSKSAGFLTGLIVNWILQPFVYKSITKEQTKSKKVFFKYVIVSLIGLGITVGGMQLGSPLFDNLYIDFPVRFSFWKLFFNCLMTGIVLVFNYLMRKFYVFKKEPE